MQGPLRLLIYDRSPQAQAWRVGLNHAWATGGALYSAIGRFDARRGVTSWGEALDFLGKHAPDAPIAEIQFWGHGRWGRALVGREALDEGALRPAHRLHDKLARVRDRLLRGEQGLWWFRTCETFGASEGRSFAQAFTRFLGCRAAGHTYVIAAIQSGLHSLLPGAAPQWPLDEGLPPGHTKPSAALWSHAGAPNTITCLHSRVPDGF